MSLQLKQMPYLLKRGAKIEKKKSSLQSYMRFQWKVQLQRKGTKLEHISVVIFFCISFQKVAGSFFFQINKSSCLAMIKKKILLICKQTEIIFGRKKTWLHHFVGSLTQLGLGTVWMNLLIVDLAQTKEASKGLLILSY